MDVILNSYIFNILEIVFVFIEILFKTVLFKGGVLIYAEHCTSHSFVKEKMFHQSKNRRNSNTGNKSCCMGTIMLLLLVCYCHSLICSSAIVR